MELELSKDTICSYSSALAIPSLTSGIFRWINEGEYTPFLDNVVNPTFGYELAGPHEIQLIYTAPNGLCSDTATATIFVDVFKITASSTPDYACTNPSTFTFNAESSDPNATYNWSLPKGMKSTKKDTTIKYIIASDTLEYGVNKQEILITSLSALSSNGCKADTILIDTVWKPNAYPIPTVTKGCVPLEVKFNGAKKSKSEGEITEYHWIFGDGKKQTTKDTIITKKYDKTGIFEARLVIKNKRGCVDSSFAIEIQI